MFCKPYNNSEVNINQVLYSHQEECGVANNMEKPKSVTQ